MATYSHLHGNWNFHLVQVPVENLSYLTYDPLENLPGLRRGQADGMIAYCFNRKVARAVHRLKMPVVGIEAEYGWGDPRWNIPFFCTDNEAIGQLGAQELIERGLKRLAFCGIPSSRVTGWSEQRQLAFENYAREAGVPCSVFPADSLPGGSAVRMHKQLSAWLKSLQKPVGLMACYDVRARHVLTACWELGLPVPEEVAVLGVDNDELVCELTSPTLSSIEQGSRTIGYQAAVLLDELMAGRKAERLKYVIPPEGVVTRRSSDALAIEDPDVAVALRFIRQYACEGIQVRNVVRAVAISRSALAARFKAVTGRTIHAEIQRVQIERARQLIVATDLPLNQVARQAGFHYLQHLITIFRRHTGMTPGEYRIRSQQGIPRSRSSEV
ncbi:MAG: DNA-binding transcriptional regulator [Pirellulales bacterium]|nr:DNA-binding transcriptional regulator [Pirellulales bacterium]